MAEQTDLLDGLEPDSAPRATAGAAVEWHELAIDGRRYRWRVRWSEVDREHWSPEDRVWEDPHQEEDGPYRAPGRAFELEYWTEGYGWRTVRFYNRRVEVWGMVRSEAMETEAFTNNRDDV